MPIAILLLGLLLCWTAPPDPDVSHYRIRFAERYIVEWVGCSSPEDPGAICPVYSPFVWAWRVEYGDTWQSPPCAERPGDLCYWQHPTAVDFSGNESPQPDLFYPPPMMGGCP